MGNIFACFGNGKNDKRQKNKMQPSPEKKVFPKENISVDLREARTEAADLAEATTVVNPVKISDVVPDFEDVKIAVPETPPLLPTVAVVTSSPKKKVTFDLNVTEYDPPAPFYDDDDGPTSSSVDTTDDNQYFFFDGCDDEEEEAKEDGEIVNPTAAYPLNHRYQDCTDDADFEDDYYEDDFDLIDGEDEEEEEEEEEEESYDSYFSLRTYKEEQEASKSVVLKDLNLIPPTSILQKEPKKLQPTPQLRRDKENFSAAMVEVAEEEEDVSVDTSLSSWLTPKKNLHDSSPSFSRSPAMQCPEERPILGALTVDDLKHSPTSTKKSSPRKSPDVEMPIVGTVGSYWSCSSNDDGKATFTGVKGIPNTTSKYREDKRVNWHSTPFEVRLDRALKSGGTA